MSSEYAANLSLQPIHDSERRGNWQLRQKIDDILALVSVGLPAAQAREMMRDCMTPAPVIKRLSWGI